MSKKTLPINGRRLAQAREAAGHSQGDLSRLSHVSRSYISEIESGLKQPSMRVAYVLAEAVGVRVDELVS